MNDLKPCPFCGEKKNLSVQFAAPYFMLRKYKYRYVFAGCRTCGATTILTNANNKTGSALLNKANTENAFSIAIEAWNRRANNESKKLQKMQ